MAEAMKRITELVEGILGDVKVIVRSANYDYSIRLSSHFENALVHGKNDRLEKTVREFQRGDYRYLFLVSAEYGGDFKDVPFSSSPRFPIRLLMRGAKR